MDDSTMIQQRFGYCWSYSGDHDTSFSSRRRRIDRSRAGMGPWKIPTWENTRSWSDEHGWSWSNDNDCWGSRSGEDL